MRKLAFVANGISFCKFHALRVNINQYSCEQKLFNTFHLEPFLEQESNSSTSTTILNKPLARSATKPTLQFFFNNIYHVLSFESRDQYTRMKFEVKFSKWPTITQILDRIMMAPDSDHRLKLFLTITVLSSYSTFSLGGIPIEGFGVIVQVLVPNFSCVVDLMMDELSVCMVYSFVHQNQKLYSRHAHIRLIIMFYHKYSDIKIQMVLISYIRS